MKSYKVYKGLDSNKVVDCKVVKIEDDIMTVIIDEVVCKIRVEYFNEIRV